MKKILLGTTMLLLTGLSACGTSNPTALTEATTTAAATNQPIYEISWSGCIGSDCVSQEVKTYVWGSPNLQERPDFKPTAVLVAGMPAFTAPDRSYHPAFESYGCASDYTAPLSEKKLYMAPATVSLPKNKYTEQRIPIDAQVKLADAQTQQKLLNPDAPQVATIGGGCEPVR